MTCYTTFNSIAFAFILGPERARDIVAAGVCTYVGELPAADRVTNLFFRVYHPTLSTIPTDPLAHFYHCRARGNSLGRLHDPSTTGESRLVLMKADLVP